MTDRVTLDDLAALDDEIAAAERNVLYHRSELVLVQRRLDDARARQHRLIERYHDQTIAPLVDEAR